MAERVEILGIYDRAKKAAVCAGAILDQDLGDVVTYSPVADHALDQAMRVRVSPVRLFVLIGGLLGCATGFIFPTYTVLDWPLITGGKPLISIPPFVVIAFELTILFATVGGMAGFLLLSRLPRMRGQPVRDTRFTNDLTGVMVTCAPEQVVKVRACLERTGASEIRQ